MSLPLRRVLPLAAVALVILPSTAGAATDDHVVRAETAAVSLSVFEAQVGSPVLELFGTDAFGTSDPMASASVTAAKVLGTAVAEGATATSSADRVSDPAEGPGCIGGTETPGLTLSAICLSATARAGTASTPANQDATAKAELASIAADGALLAGLLTGSLADTLDVVATDIVGGLLESPEVADGLAQLVDACDTVIESIPDDDNPVPGGVEQLMEQTGETLEDTLRIIQEQTDEPTCTELISLTPEELLADVIDLGPLADALDGVDLVSIELVGATSAIQGSSSAIDGSAEQVFATITGPSLDFIDDVLAAIVDGVVGGVVTEIEQTLGNTSISDQEIGQQLQDGLNQLPLFAGSPLIQATISGGTATASLDLGSAGTTAGGDLPFVSVTLSPGIIEALGGDPEQGTITVEAGQTQTIAEGTPAESTISVGDVIVDDEAEDADTGLTGSTANTSVTTVALLTGVEGGVVLSLGASNAGAFGNRPALTETPGAPAPTPEDPALPRTGGGAALGAVLAMGAGWTLLRRRDDRD